MDKVWTKIPETGVETSFIYARGFVLTIILRNTTTGRFADRGGGVNGENKLRRVDRNENSENARA